MNIALKKHAWTDLGHLVQWFGREWTAAKAVDGDTDISRRDKTCFHALSSPSDWSVDLGDEYQLYDIRVYIWNNSSPSWKTRTANSTIYLDNNNTRVCYMFPPAADIQKNPIDAICNDTGSNVTIRNPGTGWFHTNALMICEVEIYVCSAGTYGINCTDSCHCASPPCDRWTGVCSGDCAAGYRGDRCDTTCSNTTYGVNCKEKCLDRKCNTTAASCDHVTGSCDTGCLPGWMGTDCTKECRKLHYGSNCSGICADRKCEGNSSCNHVNGSCDNGCKAGWEGTDCQQSCDDEHYGPDCTGVCSNRHCEGNSTCNSTTGQCEEGCEMRWADTDCTDCDEHLYGLDCSRKCADRHCNGNSLCNEIGSCDNGCESGWSGMDCTDIREYKQVAPRPPGSIPLIAGTTAGGVLLLILVLVLVIVLIRRRRLKSTKESRGLSVAENTENNTEKGSGRKNTYNNAGFDDRKKKAEYYENKNEAHECVNGPASKDFDSKSDATLEEEEEDYDSPIHIIQQEEGPGVSERDYYNLDDARRGHVIPVAQLEARVREMVESPEVAEEEFKHLLDGFIHPYDESRKSGNKEKNRFKGYYPYNYNRVVLHDNSDDSRGDYINASYIDGYHFEKKYIAAQGPYKEDIVEDFWRMIWQEECRAVVMVTGLVEGAKIKCLRYWPEEGTLTYGDITVAMETQTQLADFTVTKLAVHHGSRKRHVTHFHFTSWPDHGVPDTSGLLTFMWRVQKTCGRQTHPVVVHCSAGIGRTGTYIAVESLVSQATAERTVDVFSFVSSMRSQRKNMIQTKEQYLFTYQAVAAAVVEGDTSLDADDIKKIELDHLAGVTMGSKTVQQHLEALGSCSEEKRTSESVKRVPSYTNRSGFFVMTSRPDKVEIWNQIYNSDSCTLITWAGNDESYLPSAGKSVKTPRLTASMRSKSVLSDDITLSKTVIKKKDDNEGIIINQYHMIGSVRDPSVSVLIDSLLQWTGQPECGSTTIVSHSVSDTRLLILLVSITSRLQDDGKVDVISNMRRLQSLLGGPRFTVDDVRLCLEFAQRRLESLGMYANL